MPNSLNPNQQKAVDLIYGPVLLLAGPGSGKTHTLTARIANILKETDTPAESILAITFTENAAANMKNRLKNYIGSMAYKVNFKTFHAFCNDIIQTHTEKFEIGSGATQITELDVVKLIEQIIDEKKLKYLSNFHDPYSYKRDIIKTISNLKNEGINPDKFLELIKNEEEKLHKLEKINPRTQKPYGKYTALEKKINKNKELQIVYSSYQAKLKEADAYDYNDMILFVIDRLERDSEFLASIQEKYLFVLVDEFQDTNGAQAKLLELLGNYDNKPNIFVVGDDDQSIFRFQGANIENIFDFLRKYPNAEKITLNQTYRCPQNLLNAALSLIEKNSSTIANKFPEINKKLKTKNPLNSKVQIREFETSEEENLFVLSEVKDLIDSGKKPKDIAIIFRNHKDADELKHLFQKLKIPANIADSKNAITNNAVRQFLTVLETIQNPFDDELLFHTLNFEFLNLDRVELFKALNTNRNNQKSLFEQLQTNSISNELNSVLSNLIKWGKSTHNLPINYVLEDVLNESGLLKLLSQTKDYEALEGLKSLFRFASSEGLSYKQKNYSLETFLQDIQAIETNNISIAMNYSDASEGVNFLTAHKSKGLEFDHVFIINTRDGVWSNKRKRDKIKLPEGLFDTKTDKEDSIEEERRLFYVALTRSKISTTVTFSKKSIENGKEISFMESQFINELNKDYTHRSKPNVKENYKTLQLAQTPEINLKEREIEYIKKLIANFKLSITALNNYLDSPEEFFYNNLLRIPRKKPVELILGSIIHKALETNNLGNKNSQQKSLEELTSILKKELKKELIPNDVHKKILTEGEKILEEYFHYIQSNQAPIAAAEYNFHASNVFLDDIQLTGKIDAIEWIDKASKLVRIVDYKTSTPKSRNQILGQTKYSDEKLLRQLQFYKLLTRLDSNFPFVPVEFELRFVKANSSGNFKSEIFDTKEIQTEKLESLIKETMGKIRNLEFWS